MAGLVAILLVMSFMVFFYKLSGLNAVAALILNVVILFGALAYFKATLTLPGIAGIILSIGMAVDANVLIFERIKEERAAGKNVPSAIQLGFSRAFSAIFDSNLTTIISAIFLFQFGTGPDQGIRGDPDHRPRGQHVHGRLRLPPDLRRDHSQNRQEAEHLTWNSSKHPTSSS